ncbi:MAG: two-component system histidine kinase PnpS [Planctomycetota bacterium]
MRRRRLLWQLYPSYVLITLVSLLIVSGYVSRSIREFYRLITADELEARACLAREQLPLPLSLQSTKAVDDLCKRLGAVSTTRITLILPTGKVIGDSEENPEKMDNHADRPEIVDAFSGRIGSSVRYSHTLKKNMMYVAIPVKEGERIVSVLRTSFPMTSVEQALRRVYFHVAGGVLVVAALAAAFSLLVSRWLSRPLEEMRRGAERFAKGDFSHKLPAPDSYEIAALAEEMNAMAEQLDDRIQTVLRQRNELEAVLSSMVEGVVAVDSEERVISVNQAAARFLGIDRAQAQGQALQVVVRNIDLQRFAASALSSREPVEAEITLHEKGGARLLQARGTVLRGGEDKNIGALLVLNDVTHLRRLENIRRDFVANVSHELRTPLTAIKGFVETLLEDAQRNPEQAERFLRIIAKQVDRLNAILEDLLTLSKLEEGDAAAQIPFERSRIRDLLEAAIQVCEAKAAAKDITIDLACDSDLAARANAPLLEQSVVNLVDNAIKYSEKGSSVRVEAALAENELAIRVQDRGCGIEKKHLPRLFERFYRVDKARSRSLGGTGLGLAIVKHIAQVHGGRIEVQSFPGKGSTFTLFIPNK